MRYEVKQETDAKGVSTGQFVIWDNLESRVFARFAERENADKIVDKWRAAQLAAEYAG
jgi:hypothetical protein